MCEVLWVDSPDHFGVQASYVTKHGSAQVIAIALLISTRPVGFASGKNSDLVEIFRFAKVGQLAGPGRQ